MPRGVDIANAIAGGVGAGVNIGSAINQRRQAAQAQSNYEAKTAEEQRRYDYNISKAEADEAEGQLLATEEARIQGEQMRLDRSNVPGYDQDVRESSAIDATMRALEESMGTFKDVGMSNSLQNIMYLALEQTPDFKQTEKYITHVTGVIGRLTSQKARERFITKQEAALELNALGDEKGQFERDFQQDVSIGNKYSTAPNPLEGPGGPNAPNPTGQAARGPSGQPQQASGGSNQFAQSPQFLEGARGMLDSLGQAWDEAQSTGDIGIIRAARGMIRQFRAGTEESAQQAKVQRRMVSDFSGRMGRIDADLAEAYASGNERVIEALLEDKDELENSFSSMVGGGYQGPSPQDLSGQQTQGQGGVPTPDQLEQMRVERDARRGGGGAPASRGTSASTIEGDASAAKAKADDLERRAAALEQFDPAGATALRDQRQEILGSPEAKAPEIQAERRVKLSAKLSELGVQSDVFGSATDQARVLAELYKAIHDPSKGGLNRIQMKNKVGTLFNLGIDEALKAAGNGREGGGSVASSLTARKGNLKPKFTLDEIIEKFTQFDSLADALEAEAGNAQPTQSQSQSPPISPAQAAPQASPSGAPVRQANAEGVNLDVLGTQKPKPKTLPPGAAGGMSGGRK